MLEAPTDPKVPPIPNPDAREWHPLTRVAWQHAWESPMSTQWLDTDVDGLARLAVLWDNFYKTGHIDYIKEIRLQGAAFGLTPLDRSRLQWEVARGDDAAKKLARPESKAQRMSDPRKILRIAASQ